ncbi:MAG: hypothetical protein E7118_08460 [Bacteroidales bacterium]|nr:hypothetical protein [Bacteroidales bacterium]MBE6234485.1 hypothetical protein [Bacteroidales bacterium]
MARNDFSGISTIAQLRTARKELSDRIAGYEKRFYSGISGLRSAFSLKFLMLAAIRKLRRLISGTPFAKS